MSLPPFIFWKVPCLEKRTVGVPVPTTIVGVSTVGLAFDAETVTLLTKLTAINVMNEIWEDLLQEHGSALAVHRIEKVERPEGDAHIRFGNHLVWQVELG